MNILLTNDDGYDAAGLQAAWRALTALGRVCVVVPKSERSACSHSIALRGPITVERRNHPVFGTSFAVDGSPADCVRLAVAALSDKPLDLVVSGINHGANAGVDTFYSGTVAGAREAAILGLPAIAFSQARRGQTDIDWGSASAVARIIAEELAGEPLPGPGFWNVNFPMPIPPQPRKHIHRVPVAMHPMPMSFERRSGDDGVLHFDFGASYWQRETADHCDYVVLRDGGITISAIPLHGKF
jgi:5'-nucleotidase